MSNLLIYNPQVRLGMIDAYRQSGMGGLVPQCRVPPGVSERIRDLHRDEHDPNDVGREHSRVQREHGGKILRDPNRGVRTVVFTNLTESACTADWLPTRPKELNIRDDPATGQARIGNAVIIGSFHTHSSPRAHGPSPADTSAFSNDPAAMGDEHYVIQIDQVFLIWCPTGSSRKGRPFQVRSLGTTRALLWPGT